MLLLMCLGSTPTSLKLRGGHTLYFHDVLYAPEVRRNLVSLLVLLELDFCIVFDSGCVKVFLDNIYYGYGYLSNGFMVLETVNVFVNDDTSKLLVISVLLMIMIVSFDMLDKDTLGKIV